MPNSIISGVNIVSPLGFTMDANFGNVFLNKSGVSVRRDPSFIPVPFSAARIQDDLVEQEFSRLNAKGRFTRLEKITLLSLANAIAQSEIDPSRSDTLFVFSTTKGNVDLLKPEKKAGFEDSRIQLWRTAQVLAEYFKNPNRPVVISNACISGVVALIYAAEQLKLGKFSHAMVCGFDELTEFVVSGFQSFLAISGEPCKPFDKFRNGISLGEAAATIVLSADVFASASETKVEILGGATSNDANHISGPSRTGEGLVKAIEHALKLTGLKPGDLDYISAHGTATPYNDEMEAIAFSRTGLENVPLNSFKGYYGHTLGAAGVLETALTFESMKNNMLIKSLGYQAHGVSKPVNILSENKSGELKTVLKVASGFGGCNAAMILKKHGR